MLPVSACSFPLGTPLKSTFVLTMLGFVLNQVDSTEILAFSAGRRLNVDDSDFDDNSTELQDAKENFEIGHGCYHEW